MRCKCCEKEIKDKMANQLYCLNCAIYVKDLKKKIVNLKHRLKVLKKE